MQRIHAKAYLLALKDFNRDWAEGGCTVMACMVSVPETHAFMATIEFHWKETTSF